MDELGIKFRIKMLTIIEKELFEIKEQVDTAKNQGKKSITINGDLHPLLLEKLIKKEKMFFIKRRYRIFGKKTIIYWED